MSEEQVDRKDKNCLLKFTEDDVLLKFRPDSNPDLMEIENFLEKNNILDADYEKIINELKNQQKEWFKIAKNINLPSEDDQVEIEVSNDKLKVLLDFTPGRDGKEIKFEDLKNMLADKKISFGIKENKIKYVSPKAESFLIGWYKQIIKKANLEESGRFISKSKFC